MRVCVCVLVCVRVCVFVCPASLQKETLTAHTRSHALRFDILNVT